MEIEALESILMGDMRKLPDDSGDGIASIANCAQYQIEISAYGDNDSVPEDEDEDDAVLGLVFAHSETYPDEPPSLKCRSVRGLREHELADISAKVMKQASEIVGAPMIFDLVQTCKEWMRRRVGASDVVDEETEEQLKARLEAEAEERLRQMRLVGTPVTPENFKAWQAAYMAEMGESLVPAESRVDGRLTGRRYFETRSAKELQDDLDAQDEDGDSIDGDDDDDDDFSSSDRSDSDRDD